jgi:hypothetical protein
MDLAGDEVTAVVGDEVPDCYVANNSCPVALADEVWVNNLRKRRPAKIIPLLTVHLWRLAGGINAVNLAGVP